MSFRYLNSIIVYVFQVLVTGKGISIYGDDAFWQCEGSKSFYMPHTVTCDFRHIIRHFVCSLVSRRQTEEEGIEDNGRLEVRTIVEIHTIPSVHINDALAACNCFERVTIIHEYRTNYLHTAWDMDSLQVVAV